MSGIDAEDQDVIVARIRAQANARHYRASAHAQEELDAEYYTLDDVLTALGSAVLLENYPTYHKGPCCLVYGVTPEGRAVHAVCSTTRSILVIITVYEPLPPRWVTPTQRASR